MWIVFKAVMAFLKCLTKGTFKGAFDSAFDISYKIYLGIIGTFYAALSFPDTFF